MTLIYQAYGQQKIIHQSLFSVCSLFHAWPDFSGTVLLYTDQGASLREFFQGEPRVRVVDVTMDQIREWGGPAAFVHRVKLEILLDACRLSSERRIYLDGDTFFTQKPEALFDLISEEQSIMHIKEYELRSPLGPLPKKIARFVRGKEFQINPAKKVSIPNSTAMWNAGVIGYHKKNEGFLREALQLTDVLYGAYPKHVMEQLAVSFCLSSVSMVHSADETIKHYWQQKDFYQTYIDQFLVKHRNIDQCLKGFPDMNLVTPPPLAQKKSFRWLRRLKETFSFPRPR